jgi:hypothetical protein
MIYRAWLRPSYWKQVRALRKAGHKPDVDRSVRMWGKVWAFARSPFVRAVLRDLLLWYLSRNQAVIEKKEQRNAKG